jgi:hypothetical protein
MTVGIRARATSARTIDWAVPNFTPKMPKEKLSALMKEIEIVAIKRGSHAGFPKKARTAQTLPTAA